MIRFVGPCGIRQSPFQEFKFMQTVKGLKPSGLGRRHLGKLFCLILPADCSFRVGLREHEVILGITSEARPFLIR